MPADTGRVAVYQYWTGKMPMCKTVDHCYEGGSKTVVDRHHSGNNLGTGPVLFQYYNVYWVDPFLPVILVLSPTLQVSYLSDNKTDGNG